MGVAVFLLKWFTVAAAFVAVGAVRLPAEEITGSRTDESFPYKSMVFIKFHKVGSSTSAVRLGAAARGVGFKENCTNGGDGSFCVEHTAMHQMRNESLGSAPLTRIEALYPEPFLVTIMRDPITKFTSFIYYRAWLDKVAPSQEYFDRNLHRHWELCAEYSKTLGLIGGKLDIPRAVEVLNRFHVVGITEDMAGMLAQVARYMSLTAKDVAYLSVTTMPGRPTLEDLPVEYQKEVYRVLASEFPGEEVLYIRAKELYEENLDRYQLHGLRDEISSLSTDPDEMDCSKNVHEQGVTAGGRTCIDPTV